MEIEHLDVVAASEKGAALHLRGPNGMPLFKPLKEGEKEAEPLNLLVMGFDAEPVIEAGRTFDREQARAQRTEQLHEQDFMRLRRAALAAAAVMDWGGLTVKGEAFTRANAQRILSDRRYAWIAEQVFAFGGNRGNYFRPTLDA